MPHELADPWYISSKHGDLARDGMEKDERKVSVVLAYQDVDNVHILEAAIRVFFKKSSSRLSDLLTQTG